MEIGSWNEVTLKHESFGPGYLSRTDDAAVGIIVLRPGDTYRNHLHPRAENSFLTLEGEVELWLDQTHRLVLRAGDFVRCEPGEAHYFRNMGRAIWRAVFVRCPYDRDDSRDVPWEPPAS